MKSHVAELFLTACKTDKNKKCSGRELIVLPEHFSYLFILALRAYSKSAAGKWQ